MQNKGFPGFITMLTIYHTFEISSTAIPFSYSHYSSVYLCCVHAVISLSLNFVFSFNFISLSLPFSDLAG